MEDNKFITPELKARLQRIKDWVGVLVPGIVPEDRRQEFHDACDACDFPALRRLTTPLVHEINMDADAVLDMAVHGAVGSIEETLKLCRKQLLADAYVALLSINVLAPEESRLLYRTAGVMRPIEFENACKALRAAERLLGQLLAPRDELVASGLLTAEFADRKTGALREVADVMRDVVLALKPLVGPDENEQGA